MKGLALIELLIVIMIILICIQQNISTEAKERELTTSFILKTLKIAQIEAIYSRGRVSVCNLKQNKCSRDWNKELNLLIFIDVDRNREFDANDVIIDKKQRSIEGINIKHNIKRNVIWFYREISGGNTIKIKSKHKTNFIVISKAGRIRTEKGIKNGID